MKKILVLWATPRSTSTAFEWMMRMRGDMTCFHEPFGEWWYQGDGAQWPRLSEDSPRIPGLTFNKVWSSMQESALAGPTFSKDFPHYVEHAWTDGFLANFNHSFLIRDPAKVVTSMFKHWSDFVLKETGIVEQRELFDRICDRDGKPPPIIDSDDLLEDPHGIVERWCQGVGVPFIPDALSWEAGDRSEVSWYDGGSWHASLRNSDGLKPQPRRYVDIVDAPAHVRAIYDIVLPHYEHMHSYRLTVKS
ncbi:MAG: sulfotransferase family protein [Gammaproteobacteria bacterium]|nr:sulfotransferase family protein [Gammaproteobacteria bacterium]